MNKFAQLNRWKLLLCMAVFVHAMPLRSVAETAMSESASVVVAQKLYKRLTGITIAAPDARLTQMATLIRQGQLAKAAAIATEDPYFYQTTVKNLAAELGSRNETPYVPLDDFQATFIGTVADGLDARELLTGDYTYRANNIGVEPSRADNQHYELIDQKHLQYKSVLVKQSPQWTGAAVMRNHAGLLTSRGFGWIYDAGTNRRAVLNTFDRLLCRPIETWKIPGLNENTIGRDVDRAPGQNPKVFQKECRTCHGGLDPMRDAFASFDFLNGALIELPDGVIQPKYERGALTYPEGHITTSDHWFNPIASRREDMGFKPELTSGKGVHAFAEMIANSTAFSDCMTKRVFRSVCARPAGPSDVDTVRLLSTNFAKNGYNLKALFQEASVLPECLPTVSNSKAKMQLRSFNDLYYALSVATGVSENQGTEKIDAYYQSVMTRLPKDGQPEEVSASMLLAEKGLAALFCREMAQNPQLNQLPLPALSLRFYGRPLSLFETQKINDLIKALLKQNPSFLACVAMSSSMEFLTK